MVGDGLHFPELCHVDVAESARLALGLRNLSLAQHRSSGTSTNTTATNPFGHHRPGHAVE
jgi:hypothetical protein